MNAPARALTDSEPLPSAIVEPTGTKPILRGVSHLVGSVFALGGTVWLLFEAQTPRAWWTALIYGGCLSAMLAISGLYHTPYWRESTREWWRRIDHAAVFLLTGGCYTVFCRLAMPEEDGDALFKIIWACCALGFARGLFWPHAPRWLIAGMYVITGWLIIPWLGVIQRTVGPAGVWWPFAGGVILTLSAVVYARKWPNPWPRVFGYHEVMHLIVLAGTVVHFIYFRHLIVSAR